MYWDMMQQALFNCWFALARCILTADSPHTQRLSTLSRTTVVFCVDPTQRTHVRNKALWVARNTPRGRHSRRRIRHFLTVCYPTPSAARRTSH
jgi:hypothetical protein